MINSDEELQAEIEKGHAGGDSPDSKAYQKVFDALKKEPYQLPATFADSVVSRIQASSPGLSNDYFWFGLGIFTFITAALIATTMTDFKISFGAFKFVSGYSGLLLFGLAFILLIQWFDKQFVRRKPSF